MKLFVVSLARCVERRENMRLQLDRLGVQGEFIDAIDARALTQPEIDALCDYKWMLRYTGHRMTNGEIACAASHLRVYQKIVDEGIPFACILEDDAWLSPSAIEVMRVLEEKITNVKSDSAVYLLQETCCGRWRKKKGDVIQIGKIHRFYELSGAWWAHCYVVTYGAAKAMLDAMQPIAHVADAWGWLAHHKLIKLYGLNLTATVQNNLVTPSEIGFERAVIRRSVLEKLIRPFWRCFWLKFDRYVPLKWHRKF